MGSKCECELYGYCEPCRARDNQRAGWRAAGGDGEPPPIKVYSSTHLGVQQCQWCKLIYKQSTMFRFGKNRWNKWVCGPDCLLRPDKGLIWKGRNKVTASKKLYELLAFDLVRAMPNMTFGQYEALVKRVGRTLEQDNPNFDWVRWLRATGIAKGAGN